MKLCHNTDSFSNIVFLFCILEIVFLLCDNVYVFLFFMNFNKVSTVMYIKFYRQLSNCMSINIPDTEMKF